MKESKVLGERIRRSKVLFRELGYRILGGERTKDAYTAAFSSEDGAQGSLFIDRESRFLELGYTYGRSGGLLRHARGILEELARVTGETAHLGTLQDFEVAHLDGEQPDQLVLTGLRIGRRIRSTVRPSGRCSWAAGTGSSRSVSIDSASPTGRSKLGPPRPSRTATSSSSTCVPSPAGDSLWMWRRRRWGSAVLRLPSTPPAAAWSQRSPSRVLPSA